MRWKNRTECCRMPHPSLFSSEGWESKSSDRAGEASHLDHSLPATDSPGFSLEGAGAFMPLSRIEQTFAFRRGYRLVYAQRLAAKQAAEKLCFGQAL